MLLNNLLCDKHICDNIINGKSIRSLRVFNGYIQNIKKQIPQYLIFRCGLTYLNYSLTKLGITFKLQKEILKTEMNHDEIYVDNWRDKKDECVDYVKNYILCTAFIHARYSKAMENITGLSMKACLSLPRIAWKFFNSLRTEEDEPTYRNIYKYKRCFVRQSIERGRVCAFIQKYKLKICVDILGIISEELNVKVNIHDNMSIPEL